MEHGLELILPSAVEVNIQVLAGMAGSLGIGLLIGLERERHPGAKAGVRTFALVSLLGTLAAVLAEKLQSPWLVPVGLAVVGGMLIAAFLQDEQASEPGTTTVAAAAVTYLLGVLTGVGEVALAGTLAIATMALLYFKTELEGLSTRLSRQDFVSILQFLVIAVIVLPIAPDQAFGPYGVLNPRQIWLVVVLVSAVGMTSYVLLHVFGQTHSITIAGLLGGLVSSTATTVLYARRASESEAAWSVSLNVILLANLVPIGRVVLITAAMAPGVLGKLAPIAAASLGCGLLLTAMAMRRLQRRGDLPSPQTRNPAELKTALTFGAVYAIVSLAGAWLLDIAGSGGVYGTALVSGLLDVDAATLSALNLFLLARVSQDVAVGAIGLAFLANMSFKLGVMAWYGGPRMAAAAALPLGAAAVGGVTAFAFV